MEPKIVFEDDNLLVIDKPAGMVVNKAETTREGETVQEWVEKEILRDEDIKILGDSDFVKRVGIVHRLDKETSGLLLVAKTLEAFENLQRQFKERKVKKKYLALVHGKVVPPQGEIKAPVGRLSWSREKFGVVPGGRIAKTEYKTISNLAINPSARAQGEGNQQFSFLEIKPETGRTHQIRVHLKYLGYSVVSDEKYAGRKTSRQDRKWCPRMFLHAFSLGFFHPKTGEWVEFESRLPDELKIDESLVTF